MKIKALFTLKIAAFALTFCQVAKAFPIHHIQTLIQQSVQSGKRPVGVFDLDETLVHGAKRKVLSYRAAIERNPSTFAAKFPTETRALLSRSVDDQLRILMSLNNQYDCKAWISRMGIQNELFRIELDKAMMPIYLNSEFMHFDRAYHGAQALLNLFYKAGGEVYFVSSRYRLPQYDATLRQLVTSGLYSNPRQSFVILREEGETSPEFKSRAFNFIRQKVQSQSKVVLVAENEPENLNIMINLFPDATPVFVMGAVANTTAILAPHPRLIKTKTFLAGESELR